MSTDAIYPPNDLTVCHAMIAKLHEQLLELQRQVEQLKYQNDYLKRRIYGPRSERIDPNQLALFELELGADKQSPVPTPAAIATASRPQKNGHGRQRFPEHWPRRRKVFDIDEKDKICPCCGKDRRVIGEVITERAGLDPPKPYVMQYVQLKYACHCEQSGVITAEKPIMPIEKGSAEPDLLAFTAVSRFDDHSPYYRQEKGQFRRAGFHVSRSTQCDWMRDCRALSAALRTDARIGFEIEFSGYGRHDCSGDGSRSWENQRGIYVGLSRRPGASL